VTMIPLHATGHEWANDGTLLRVDLERGFGWVATHYDQSLRVIRQLRGSDEDTHRAEALWAQGQSHESRWPPLVTRGGARRSPWPAADR
jgi:hypothetical protein